MSLQENVYRVLLLSHSSSFNKVIKDIFPTFIFTDCDNVSNGQRLVSENNYDFIIINAPIKEELGHQFAIECSVNKTNIVLYVINEDLYNKYNEIMAKNGVFVLSKPLSRRQLMQSINHLICTREKMRMYENKIHSMDARIRQMRLMNQAKCLLMSVRVMSEEQAHHYIEKYAMDHCISKNEAALLIINQYK